MSLIWIASVIAVTAASVWLIELWNRPRPRYRNVLQVLIVLIAFTLLILGFLSGIQEHALSE